MNPRPEPATVPAASRAATLLQDADFHDAWRISSARTERSALAHFIAAMRTTPPWV